MTHTLQHAHDLIPPWVHTLQEMSSVIFVGIMAYMAVAFLFGCPFCPYPDMAWPKTLVKRLLRS